MTRPFLDDSTQGFQIIPAGNPDADSEAEFDLPYIVASNIRSIRSWLGITQSEMAARLGCRASYVSWAESGQAKITIAQLGEIARALGVTPAVLCMRVLPPKNSDLPPRLRPKRRRIIRLSDLEKILRRLDPTQDM